jgi:hypothetical protein
LHAFRGMDGAATLHKIPKGPTNSGIAVAFIREGLPGWEGCYISTPADIRHLGSHQCNELNIGVERQSSHV